MNGEFYVGYQPRAPGGLATFLKRAVAILAVFSAGVGFLLVMSQAKFDASAFAYLDYQPHKGVLRLDPYPRLDGKWLVAPGKHGLGREALGAISNPTSLQGAFIKNGADAMLEVLPGSIRQLPASGAIPERDFELGEASLTGEIVDTKCYFGVMNPGRGKVHRACAARCLSGGIPAGLLVRDSGGEKRVVILASTAGGPVSREIAPMAGERVTVAGVMVRSRGSLILKIDPARIVRE